MSVKTETPVNPSEVCKWPRWKGHNKEDGETHFVFAPNKQEAIRKIVNQFLQDDEDRILDLEVIECKD